MTTTPTDPDIGDPDVVPSTDPDVPNPTRPGEDPGVPPDPQTSPTGG